VEGEGPQESDNAFGRHCAAFGRETIKRTRRNGKKSHFWWNPYINSGAPENPGF